VIDYEQAALDMKALIDSHPSYKVTAQDLSQLRTTAQRLFDFGTSFQSQVRVLKETHQQFRVPFIFKKKDYSNYVRLEMNEIKKIMTVFKVRGEASDTEEDTEQTQMGPTEEEE